MTPQFIWFDAFFYIWRYFKIYFSKCNFVVLRCVQQNCKLCTPWQTTDFVFIISYFFTVTHKYNFLWTPSKSTAFLLTTLTTLMNVQHHCAQTSYTEFHPNRTLNMESTDKISFALFNEAWLSLCRFMKLKIKKKFGISCYEILQKYTNILENRAKLHLSPQEISQRQFFAQNLKHSTLFYFILFFCRLAVPNFNQIGH